MEIMVATTIMLVCLIPILYLLTSTRTETSKTVHRLRVMELVHESVDWIHSCPYGSLEALANVVNGDVAGVPITGNENVKLDPFLAQTPAEMAYSKEYGPMKRTIDITPVTGSNDWLKKASIRIDWTEGRGAYSWKLSTLCVNENALDY